MLFREELEKLEAAALQHKRKPASAKPLPPEAEVLAEQYREAVVGRFPKGCASRCWCATRRASSPRR